MKLRSVGGTASAVSDEASDDYGFDPWSTSGEYSRDDYYIRSTDVHGHSTTVRVAVPTHMGADMDRLIASKRTPYRSREDICRDGIFHVLQYRNENVLQDAQLAATLSLEARRCRYQELLSRAMEEQQLVEDARAAIAALKSMHSSLLDQALGLVEDDMEQVDAKAQEQLAKLLKKRG